MSSVDDVMAEADKVAGEAGAQTAKAKPRRRPENIRGRAKEAPPKAPSDTLKEESQSEYEGPKRRPPRKGTLEDRLAQFLAGTALIPAAMGDGYAAYIIQTRTQPMAAAWAELAKENPRVKRILEGMLEGGAWSGVVVSSAAVLIPLAGHYGMLPGVGDPFQPFYPQLPQGVAQNVHQKKGKKAAGQASASGGGKTTPPDANGVKPTHVTVGDKIPQGNPFAG